MSKIDLTKFESIRSPDELNTQVLSNAKKQMKRTNKEGPSSFRLKIAASYCFGLLTFVLFSLYDTPNPNGTIQEQVTSADIDLSSLQIISRGSPNKKTTLDIDAMPISKLKEIHTMLVQNDDWEEARKLSIYIQKRQGESNER